MAMIHRPKVERTYCTTNQECTLAGDDSATCALVGDFSLGTSYGSIPCNLCSSQEPVCLVTDSSSSNSGAAVGVCSCMQQTTTFQSCSRVDVAMRVIPDASQLCAVSLHAGASSRTISAMYEWNYLAAAPCVLISMGNAYCYEVSRYGLLVVGHGVVRTTSTIIGGGARRRLLSQLQDDGEGLPLRDKAKSESDLESDIHSFGAWNHTARPCSTLVDAYFSSKNRMGVLDMEQLERCVHWRKVARSMIVNLNITGMLPATPDDDCCSHLFMSVQDFLDVLVSHKGVPLQLGERLPDVMLAWAKGTSLYARAMGLWDSAQQHVALRYMDAVWRNVLAVHQQHGGNVSFSNASETAEAADREMRLAARKWMRQHMRYISILHANSPTQEYVQSRQPKPTGQSIHQMQQEDTAAHRHESAAGVNVAASSSQRRRLLSVEQDDTNVVDTYTSLVASQKGFSNLAIVSAAGAGQQQQQGSRLVTETWLEGPFGWPPRCVHMEYDDMQCTVLCAFFCAMQTLTWTIFFQVCHVVRAS